MRSVLSDDQEFFRSTTARFPQRVRSTSEAPRTSRGLGPGSTASTGVGAPSWDGRRCWFPRSNGGGSISGNGLADLTLVAHEFGMGAAPGPLAAVNLVAMAFSDAGSTPDVVAGILAGSTIATRCGARRCDVGTSRRGRGAG